MLFAKIARHLGCRAPFAAAIALAFVPLVYISSVGAKDYVWAVTALLADPRVGQLFLGGGMR